MFLGFLSIYLCVGNVGVYSVRYVCVVRFCGWVGMLCCFMQLGDVYRMLKVDLSRCDMSFELGSDDVVMMVMLFVLLNRLGMCCDSDSLIDMFGYCV